ncbi:hypothetical protein [Flavobacterium beibuense]|uniref:Uncharacterized protein n=1 Tax=Flavobacterium beibuense TaxID=657326 RepID=A0A444W6L2_9FLAO|nr:hypothetical protein [Flavobacterium beibuense]RYJ41376.1 hypothetical protein NU09_3119 [Flavobacterium beibuense]
MKYIIFISLLSCLISCDTRNKQSDRVETKESPQELFFPNYARGDVKNDTLYLEVMIDDCGEFGGPSDNFKVYVDSYRNYRLEYKRFRFNCDSIQYYYELETKPIGLKEDILLNDNKKRILSLFMENLLMGKVSEQVSTNAGSYYHLYNSDSTLNISVHSENGKLENEFYNFKKELGFPENKRKFDE